MALRRSRRAGLLRTLPLLCLGAAPGAAGDAAAPARRPDLLFVGAQVLDVSGTTGGVLSLDWSHPLSARVTLLAGAAHTEVAAARWTFGRIGGAWGVAKRTALEGEADLGGGSDQGSGFDYRVARAMLTQTLVPRRLDGFLQDRYIDIGTARGNLVKAGVGFPVGAIGSARVAYEWTTAGNLDSTSWSAGFDLRPRRLGYLGGFSVGDSLPSASPLLPLLPATSTNEIYFGMRVPLRSIEMLGVASSLDIGDTRKNSLAVSFRLPL